MSYLAAITKGVATTSEVRTASPRNVFGNVSVWTSAFLFFSPSLFPLQFVSKINMVYDRHGIGRRTRGLLF